MHRSDYQGNNNPFANICFQWIDGYDTTNQKENERAHWFDMTKSVLDMVMELCFDYSREISRHSYLYVA